jgi:hypothetical protein
MFVTPLVELLEFTSCSRRRAIYFADRLDQLNVAGVSPDTLARWMHELLEHVINHYETELDRYVSVAYDIAASSGAELTGIRRPSFEWSTNGTRTAKASDVSSTRAPLPRTSENGHRPPSR